MVKFPPIMRNLGENVQKIFLVMFGVYGVYDIHEILKVLVQEVGNHEVEIY